MTEVLGKRQNHTSLSDKTTKKIKDKTLSDSSVNGLKTKNKIEEEEDHVETVVAPKKRSKTPVTETEPENNTIKIKISDKDKQPKKGKEGPKKVFLPPDQIEARIKELQQRVAELEGTENANKRKRAYQKLIQYKKALGKPEEFIVDPTEKLRKKEEDKEKRVQKKIEKSESQKVVPLSQKKKNSYCIICKERGHYAETCRQMKVKPLLKELEKHLCFNCGSSEHNLHTCPEKRGAVLAFATCFHCKEKGHLSRDCPKNEIGIYHKGGSCFECGSVRHLAKECPVRWGPKIVEDLEVLAPKGKKEKIVQKEEAGSGEEDMADENDIFSDEEDA